MKITFFKLPILLTAIIFILTLSACSGQTDGREPISPDNDIPEVCQHQYEYDCSTVCFLCNETRDNPLPHAYPEGVTCRNINCEWCGSILEQDHTWQEISLTATLISAGTLSEQCSKCQEICNTELERVDPETLGMPVVYITDTENAEITLTELEKSDGEIAVKYKYVSSDESIENFECFTAIKIQGASSASYPKKNFTVKFFENEALTDKFNVDLGWGKQSKYCMKANYVDFSQARNIIGARMFARLVSSRENINPGLAAAPNYGVIDGYPILVYINGDFHGLYTMNIPKDEWMFGMRGNESSREALLMADAWTGSVALREEIGDSFSHFGWELEHCSTADDAWVKESFNELIALLNCGDDAKIKRELPYHLDIEAAIDNMIFTSFINAVDNTSKNVLWATYDGKVWIPSMYDMDGTFGIYWNGDPTGPNTYPKIKDDGSFSLPGNSKLYEVLIYCYADEVEARYTELRSKQLTKLRTVIEFENFFKTVPDVVYISDAEKWPDVPYPDKNLENMYYATERQLILLDAFFLKFNRA